MDELNSTKTRKRVSAINDQARKFQESSSLRRTKENRFQRLQRKERKKKVSPGLLFAYDFETTPIKKGTPSPLYFTCYGEMDNNHLLNISERLSSIEDILSLFEKKLLIDEFCGARFVAWNANGFDAYFVAAALLTSDRWIIRPYLTKSKSLRGLRVFRSDNFDPDEKNSESWEFLDGIAMLGMQCVKLKNFLKSFAPDYEKLVGPDFDAGEIFDANNVGHVEYAERDSEGLYYAMRCAEQIVVDTFNEKLAATIGNTAIKIFQSHIPEGTIVKELPHDIRTIVSRVVMRGGYCHCVGKYKGPIWKYDLNQAYAAAMREIDLPADAAYRVPAAVPRFSKCFLVRLSASNHSNTIPFYFKTIDGVARFAIRTIDETWLTSLEYAQLVAEKWKIKVVESVGFESMFRMKEYVDKLEHLRINAPGGTKSAQGQVVKYIGCNSYGKTVETLDGLEILMCKTQPEGFSEWMADDMPFQHAWFRLGEAQVRPYHQPHIGAFITAHVRMVLRRAILLDVDHWLYADTDCAIFSRPVTGLDIDPVRYGAWKQETNGEIFKIITKKVYANEDASQKHAKGVNINKLTCNDFDRWFDGESPIQVQIQRVSFPKVMAGENMFRERIKRGQIIK